MGTIKRMRSWAGAVAAAAALGFGATQALAAPGTAAESGDRCTNGTCYARCVNLGYAGGSCVGATCTCWTAG